MDKHFKTAGGVVIEFVLHPLASLGARSLDVYDVQRAMGKG